MERPPKKNVAITKTPNTRFTSVLYSIVTPPFFVVKAEGKEIGEATLKEAAIATASYSRAWKLGLAVAEVYYVDPEQLSKTPKSGEYLSRGAFIVSGKRNYVTPEIKLAVGMLKDGLVMGGPVSAVEKHCEKFVVVVQGTLKPSDIAKKIKKIVGGDLDDIIRSLPAGSSDISK